MRYEGTSAPARKAGIAPGLHFKTTTATALPPATTLSVPSIRSAEADIQSATSAASRPADLSVDATFPTTGKRKLLVLLVNFADTRTTYTQQHFHDMMNLSGYGGVGSFRDYYLEQSYGKLDIDVTVSQWITVPHNKAVYNTDNAQNLVVEALQMVADTLDLHQFDNDGDGVLDGLAVIHQGYGQEMSADDGDIWSHSTVVYGTTVGGVRLARYTIEPEMLAIDRRQSTIGVICHEFGHNLGAPDFYDTDYAGSDGEFPGTGAWDLMGSGAWNGDYGTHPAGINAFQKWVMGWNEVRDLETDTTVTALGPADRHPEAYRLLTTTPGDYFILENRQTTAPPSMPPCLVTASLSTTSTSPSSAPIFRATTSTRPFPRPSTPSVPMPSPTPTCALPPSAMSVRKVPPSPHPMATRNFPMPPSPPHVRRKAVWPIDA